MPRINKSLALDNGEIQVVITSEFYSTTDKSLMNRAIELIADALNAY